MSLKYVYICKYMYVAYFQILWFRKEDRNVYVKNSKNICIFDFLNYIGMCI